MAERERPPRAQSRNSFPPKSSQAKPSSGKSGKSGGKSGKNSGGKPAQFGRKPVPRAQPVRGQSPRSASRDHSAEAAEGERLHKVLSQAGVASRRAAEEMIAAGRVEVDGELVLEQGRRIDPATATIHVDGARVVANPEAVHLLLNKPTGIVCSMSDDQRRPCIGDYLRKHQGKLFHVGRLDIDTEGLLLITNDGELAHRLMHPSFEVPKTYMAEIPGPLPKDLGKQLKDGIELEDGFARFTQFRVLASENKRALVEVVLHEGRNRIVRRLFKAAGFPVRRLVRTKVGDVRITDERPGALRPLNRKELGSLYQAVGL